MLGKLAETIIGGIPGRLHEKISEGILRLISGGYLKEIPEGIPEISVRIFGEVLEFIFVRFSTELLEGLSIKLLGRIPQGNQELQMEFTQGYLLEPLKKFQNESL